jgi:hypothetical protein
MSVDLNHRHASIPRRGNMLVTGNNNERLLLHRTKCSSNSHPVQKTLLTFQTTMIVMNSYAVGITYCGHPNVASPDFELKPKYEIHIVAHYVNDHIWDRLATGTPTFHIFFLGP